VWSTDQYANWINRDLSIFSYLLNKHREPFYLFYHTVTSVVHYPSLSRVVDLVFPDSVYAGVIFNHHNPLVSGDTVEAISGAGYLISRDYIEVIVERSISVPKNVLNDVWLGLVLRDIPKLNLSRKDITVNSLFPDIEFFEDVRRQLRVNLINGVFHFRINSLPVLTDPSLRARYDWEIYKWVFRIVHGELTP